MIKRLMEIYNTKTLVKFLFVEGVKLDALYHTIKGARFIPFGLRQYYADILMYELLLQKRI